MSGDLDLWRFYSARAFGNASTLPGFQISVSMAISITCAVTPSTRKACHRVSYAWTGEDEQLHGQKFWSDRARVVKALLVEEMVEDCCS
ncbi:hypothetical protein LENED_007880 [Lentinula edodes]|uniref:Uncharacterized protein n=1 Tax=Lentinula edodes TaxID=5353 RepID=A0A1Q3EFP8_LENED|nr:hypothetical protein LENED_007880 [Lentinula edodes]